jgi:hypothetical protein
MATRPAPKPSPKEATSAIAATTSYLERTADPRNSVLLVIPLFVLYQVGILLTDGWRNGVDFVSGWLMRGVDGNLAAYVAINLLVLAAGALFVWRQPSNVRLKSTTLIALLFESSFYAIAFAGLVSSVLLKVGFDPALGPTEAGLSPLDAVVLSIGAGTYEELVFRVFCFAGGYRFLRLFVQRTEVAMVAALLGSSLVFSMIHYAPFGMDTFTMWSFTFRALLGVLFGLLFWSRGFAVAVYTHALYDIFILVPRSFGADS